MKPIWLFVFLFVSKNVLAQDYHVQLNAGNYEEVVSSCYDREKNELITLDKAGFVVTWDAESFTILSKFQLPPANLYASAKLNILARPEINAFKNVVTVTYPNYVNIVTEREELVDMLDRKTGAFKMQSKMGRITRYLPLKMGGLIGAMVNTKPSGNFNFVTSANIVRATDSGTIAASDKLTSALTFLDADGAERVIAIGYEKGKLEIRDAQTLQVKWGFDDYASDHIPGKVCEVAFFPNQPWVAYNVFNSNKVIIRNYLDGKLVDSLRIGEDATSGNFDLAISPNNQYLCVNTKVIGQLFIYDTKSRKTSKLPGMVHSSLSNVHFKNDNLLIATGINRIETGLSSTTNTGKAGAYIGLIDWRNGTVSPNMNIAPVAEWVSAYGTSISKPNPLETVLVNTGGQFAYLQPQSLQVNKQAIRDFTFEETFTDFWNSKHKKPGDSLFSYTTSLFERGMGNLASDLVDPKIGAVLFHKGSSFSRTESDSFFVGNFNLSNNSFLDAHVIRLPKDSMQWANNYQLIGSVHAKGLSIFSNIAKDAAGKRFDRLIIFDANGKRVWEDAFFDGYSPSNKLAVSPDAKWLAYQNGAEKIIVLSLSNFSIHKTINTGFKMNYGQATGFGHSFFAKGNANMLLHQVYKTNAQGTVNFCMVKADIVKGGIDTICTFPLAPLAYDLDSSAQKLFMVYNYNFMDSIWNIQEKATALLEENFKAAYRPSVLVYDTEKKDFVHSIQTGNIGLQDIAVCGKWISLMQTDGQLLYINHERPQQIISHAFNQGQQALVADSFYYASKEMVPYIQLNKNGQHYTATQVDILLNRPHALIEGMSTGNDSIGKPFRLAYEKRLQQQNMGSSNIAQLLASDSDVQLRSKQQQSIYAEKHALSIPLEILGNSKLIKKVSVNINSFPVSGRKGIDPNKIIKDKKVDLVLNDLDNYITIQAEKTDGTLLPPLRYYYSCKADSLQQQNVYFFSVGVSNYKDSTHNLKYAAKDAMDIVQALKHSGSSKPIVHTLTNENATLKNIAAWKSILEKTNEQDIVILYFAGHGLLDRQYNFYYASHETDFANPERKSLSYDAILDLLDASPSRKKILLLDACHSGAFDRSIAKKDFSQSNAGNGAATISSNEARSTIKPKGGGNIGEKQAFLLMNELFTDYSNEIGVDVIAASLGNSYALEKADLQNGLFTYSLIRAIGLGYASNKNDASDPSNYVQIFGVTLPEVKAYIDKEVRRLSNGAQVPNIRSNSVYSKDIYFGVPNLMDVINDKEFDAFLKKYL